MHFACDGIDHLQCNVIITILTLPIEQWILQSVIEPIRFADTLKCVFSSTKHNVTTTGLITNNNCANLANGGSIVTPLMFSGWRSISSNDNRVIIWWLILRSNFELIIYFRVQSFVRCATSLFSTSATNVDWYHLGDLIDRYSAKNKLASNVLFHSVMALMYQFRLMVVHTMCGMLCCTSLFVLPCTLACNCLLWYNFCSERSHDEYIVCCTPICYSLEWGWTPSNNAHSGSAGACNGSNFTLPLDQHSPGVSLMYFTASKDSPFHQF